MKYYRTSFCIFCLYLVVHKNIRDTLRHAAGFDAAVIVIANGMSQITEVQDLIKNSREADKLLPTFDIIFMATPVILRITADSL